jgi:hypothetical protein
MKVPNCSEHGNLVLELARGRLQDREAVRAEQVRVGCDHCAGWWNQTFGADSLSALDAAVEEALSSWTPPARRRHAWLAVAAAAVLAIGLGSTTLMVRDGRISPAGATSPSAPGELVSVMDFEDPSAAKSMVADGVTPEAVEEADSVGAVFVSGLESGDFSGWSTHS